MSEATEVSICSNALIRLGADPISSFDEADLTGSNIDRARIASNLWPTVRQQVLRAHPWNCCLKSVQLSPDALVPVGGRFTRRFQKPGDWIRTIDVSLDRYSRCDWRDEGNYLLSNGTVLFLTYVFDNKVPATYDGALVGVMEAAMAAAMAYAVTKSSSLATELKNELTTMILPAARAQDGQDDPPQTLGDSPLVAARFGSFRRPY